MSAKHPINFQQPFRLADWVVDPAACRIQRAEQAIKLEPRAMNVLVCLARHAGEVMSREALEAEVWRDMVVGYDALASSIIKLRRAFGDDTKNPQFIETVPKRGYRLIAEVGPQQTGAMEPPSAAHSGAPGAIQPGHHRVWVPMLVVSVFVALAALLATWWQQPAASASQRSIAVLPFKNLSNDADQDYFSDGMTADLITDLSRIASLAVIARNSVFAYKSRDVDVRQLGEELGVDYVLEGSVRKAGNTVRISARLIDTRNGHNLWAERFDGELKNIFVLQDEVTSKIVSSLEIRLTENERAVLARKYTRSIAAYDEFLHGWQYFWILSRETNHRAREYFLKAIELDSGFARAYANLALTHAYDYTNAWHDDPDYSLAQARLYASKAVELDPALPQVHWVRSLIHVFSKEYQSALKEAQLTLVDDPNSADGHGIVSTALNYAGKPGQALEAMKRAMRLNPHYPYIYLVIRGEIYFNLHDYKHAIQDFEAALDRNPEAQEARLWLAAAYAHNGRPDDAGWQLEQIRYTGTHLTLDYVENVVPFNDPAQRRHLLDGLYKAGLKGR